MEIHLIRHTTPDIEKGICYGQSDISLKPTFEIELDDVIYKIPPGAEAIYTSPLNRCMTMATYLKKLLNLPVIQDDRLKELNFGNWEMKRWNDIEESSLMTWMNNYEDERCPQGESYRDLTRRTDQFFHHLKTTQNKSVIVVTHAGVIKSAHAVLCGLSLKEAMGLNFDYGSVSTIRVNNSWNYVR